MSDPSDKLSHLMDLLNRLQAKEEPPNIPKKVYLDISQECIKRNIAINDLDSYRLRYILKKLNYRKYYEHCPYMLQVLKSNPALVI